MNFKSTQPMPLTVEDIMAIGAPGSAPGMVPTQDAFGGMRMDGPVQGWMKGSGIGLNMPTFNLGVGALNTIGGLWAASNAAKMAKKQFQFSKNFANANLANQTQSYNTAISDRARSRGAVEGQSASQIADYITKNSLTQRSLG